MSALPPKADIGREASACPLCARSGHSRPCYPINEFAERALRNVGSGLSFRLDVGRPDHLGPLLGLFGDELGEVGGRAPKRYAAKFGKPCLRRGIGKRRINPAVELIK